MIYYLEAQAVLMFLVALGANELLRRLVSRGAGSMEDVQDATGRESSFGLLLLSPGRGRNLAAVHPGRAIDCPVRPLRAGTFRERVAKLPDRRSCSSAIRPDHDLNHSLITNDPDLGGPTPGWSMTGATRMRELIALGSGPHGLAVRRGTTSHGGTYLRRHAAAAEPPIPPMSTLDEQRLLRPPWPVPSAGAASGGRTHGRAMAGPGPGCVPGAGIGALGSLDRGRAHHLALGLVWGSLSPVATIHDEAAYLLQAQLLASGRLVGPGRPLPEFFEQFHVFVTPLLTGKYPLGFALALVPGIWLGLPALIPLLLNGVAGGLLFALARRLTTPGVAALAWLLWLLAPGTIDYHAAYLSETLSGPLWLAGWWALLEWRDEGNGRVAGAAEPGHCRLRHHPPTDRGGVRASLRHRRAGR